MIVRGDALAEIEGLGKFDAVVTDPPYASGAVRREWRSGGNVDAALHMAARSVNPNGVMLVFCASSGRSLERTASAITPVLPLARILPWSKTRSNGMAAGPFGWQTVLVLMFGKCRGGAHAADHLECEAMLRRANGSAHPAELPIAVARWLADGLRKIAPGPGSRVLDPFCGTATLLVPFAERGCEAVGIEINREWADLAERRMAGLRVGGDTKTEELFATADLNLSKGDGK